MLTQDMYMCIGINLIIAGALLSITPDAMDLSDLSRHHVVDKEVLSLSCQYHLLPVPAKVGRGDGETLNVHTLKFRIHLTIHLNRKKII